MNIVYDVFLSNPGLLNAVKSDEELYYCLAEILQFVAGRLQPLKEEIEREESADPNELKGTIIFLESPPEDPTRLIGFHGYSKELTAKMAGSFVDGDLNFMKYKVENYLNSRKN